MQSSTLKDIIVVLVVSGVTTLNVRLSLCYAGEKILISARIGFPVRGAYCSFTNYRERPKL